MSKEYDRRVAVVESLRAGHSVPEIIKWFGFPKSTVYDIAKRFNDGAESVERKEKTAHKPIRNKAFISRVQKSINKNPSTSIRKLSKDMNVSHYTMRRVICDDLRYKSYVLKVRQMLSASMKEKRVAKCSVLLASIKHEAAGKLRFFSDEKIFTVDAKVNRRNDRWLAQDPEDVPVIGQTKFPASVHVFMSVSSKGHVMPPHFFLKGQNVNKEVYLDLLIKVVKPWMDKCSNGRPYVFQQDSAPAHTSNLVQGWLEENLPMFWSKHFWPPNSPDLNPLDYYVWGTLERETNKSSHNTVESLKRAITTAAANMLADEVEHACSRFRKRIEQVIEAKGSWIE